MINPSVDPFFSVALPIGFTVIVTAFTAQWTRNKASGRDLAGRKTDDLARRA